VREIVLTRGQIALVDDEDFDRLNKVRWQARWNPCIKSFYAARSFRKNGNFKTEIMHRIVMGAPKGVLVDHRNSGDTLNNQKSNLRFATHIENARNGKLRRNNILRLKGVRKNSNSSTYQVRICVKGRSLHIGCFHDPEMAARAYDEAAVKHFGEFAHLNFPLEVVNG